MMAQYRIDYLTRDGARGVWDYEMEYPDVASVRRTLPETLRYAKTKMPEIKRLVIVEIQHVEHDAE